MQRSTNVWLLAAACLATGLSVGLLIDRDPGADFFPLMEAKAFAAHANDDFAVTTGFVEDDVEALFCLDFLTGDLKGAVIDGRRGVFNAYYQHNIAADFNLATIKNPSYLLVAGAARDLQSAGTGGMRLGRCVVYVFETTSGQAVGYAVPWNPPRRSAGKSQVGPFIPLDRAVMRTPVAVVEEAE